MKERGGVSMEYHKLVRDRIPELIERQGETPRIRILEEDAYIEQLERKLDEEVAEYHESRETEELADILEVVLALAKAHGVTQDELIAAYRRKHEARGGFDKRIFLIAKEP